MERGGRRLYGHGCRDGEGGCRQKRLKEREKDKYIDRWVFPYKPEPQHSP